MAVSNRKPQTSPAQEIPIPLVRGVAIYARVSTRDQNCELQLRELRQYAERRGWLVVGEYVDHISGSKDSRPHLNRLMADAHQRRFDAVVVWKIDRFGRSLKHLVTALADLAAYGVAFVSLRDNLDLSTPSGRLMFHVVAAMAEFERELIRERVRAGLANARAKGKRLGRRRVAVDAHSVARLRAQGRSWAEVCQTLNLSKGTAQRAVQSVADANFTNCARIRKANENGPVATQG
jgi:DNA invertase Pin-like site-specific DNA recombinase